MSGYFLKAAPKFRNTGKITYNFSKILWKIPVMELISCKVAGLTVCNFIKNELFHRYFPRILTTFGEHLF